MSLENCKIQRPPLCKHPLTDMVRLYYDSDEISDRWRWDSNFDGGPPADEGDLLNTLTFRCLSIWVGFGCCLFPYCRQSSGCALLKIHYFG